jgi:5'-methylthioadenosine phosphorylase
LEGQKEVLADTPYGQVEVTTGSLDGQEVMFLSRHGRQHVLPPHAVNYRGNIWALRALGARKIIATAAVGSLSPSLLPGDLVLPDQFLDFTKKREGTFYQGGEGVLHVDMTEPYCPEIRNIILQSASELQLKVQAQGVYVCTEGPRFETPAEIRMFHQWGGDMVGMTGVPEVVLAREGGLCYASIALVTNMAAGIADHPLSHAEVAAMTKSLGKTLAALLGRTLKNLGMERNCSCARAAKEAGKF